MTTPQIIVLVAQITALAFVIAAWRSSARTILGLEKQRDSLRELLVLSDDAGAGLREELADACSLIAAQLREIQAQNVRIAGYVAADAKRVAQRENARKLALAAIQRRKAARLARLAAEKAA